MTDKAASANGFFMEARPSPEEANRIAVVMGRPILAIDGKYYSGDVVEFDRGHNGVGPRHNEAGSVVDAINAIAGCESDTAKWLSEVGSHELEFLRDGSVDLAIDWLTELKQRLSEARLPPPQKVL